MPEVEMRPSQAYKEGQLQVYYDRVSTAPTLVKLTVPAEVENDNLRDFIGKAISLPVVRDRELKEIREQFEGGKKAVSECYFPKPEKMSDKLWEQSKKLLTHINLVQPAIRAWVNAVYSEEPYRSLNQSPFMETMKPWVEGDSFAHDMYNWAINKTAFGTSVAVPRFDDIMDEMYTWLPDPVHTHIIVDKMNRRKVLGVVELTRKRIEFVSIWGEGVVTPTDYEITSYGEELDWLPVRVGYGWDKTRDGDIYGIPMVRDAVAATQAACMVWYNTRLLQKQQTKSILNLIADLEKVADLEQKGKIKKGGDADVIRLPEGGKAEFISPSPKIEESIKVLRQQVGLLATASGIPADVLDPTLTESSASAEGSRIRAIPLIQNSKTLLRQWRSDEQAYVLCAHYMYALLTNKRESYKILKSKVGVDIGLHSAVIPQSANEETQDTIAKVAFGLMTAEDAVRKLNYTKSKTQIEEMAAVINERLAAGQAQAEAQKAVGGGRPTDESMSGAGGSVTAKSSLPI